MKIWEEKAEIQLPEGFEEATVGEKRKTYGSKTFGNFRKKST